MIVKASLFILFMKINAFSAAGGLTSIYPAWRIVLMLLTLSGCTVLCGPAAERMPLAEDGCRYIFSNEQVLALRDQIVRNRHSHAQHQDPVKKYQFIKTENSESGQKFHYEDDYVKYVIQRDNCNYRIFSSSKRRVVGAHDTFIFDGAGDLVGVVPGR
ncbi:hypothetical protein [Ottowia testudinis]|uniref:Uncharacterized protein n=1 Tax=Ottowia testudinis TaxID=2816950 RepID=A0A975CIA7_9BURK|nr:hypothetical protein [Ottowia testudinis]QTD46326.1 hypothetical protein J1M35_05380 [Ottowia testudinis]